MKGFYAAMQQHTLRLTPPAGKPMPIVIPSYNGARKQANLTPLLAMLLHKLGFPVVVHGVSHDPTRVLTETIFTLLDIPATRHAGRAQAQLEGHEPVYIPVGAFCPPLEKQLAMRWRMGVRNSAHTLAKLATPFGEGEALRLSSVSHPEYVPVVAGFFRETGGRALLMHGTEGEVYANPQRCPQISLIDDRGGRCATVRPRPRRRKSFCRPQRSRSDRALDRALRRRRRTGTPLAEDPACLLSAGLRGGLNPEQGLSRVNDCW